MAPFNDLTVLVSGTSSYEPSPVGTKATREPDLRPSALRTSTGIVTCPLLVTVAAGTLPPSSFLLTQE
jgi:hypothetical protein